MQKTVKMLDFLRLYLRKYPLSCLCFCGIIFLSLVPFFPETPLDDVQFVDKYTHVLMYGIACLVLWWEYRRSHQHPDWEKLFFWAWLMPIAMSGVLELLQEYCTGGCRNGDWFDLAANSLGVTLAGLIGFLFAKRSK